MDMVVLNEGKPSLLDWMLRTTGGELRVRMFTNDITPVDTNVYADFTQATFDGSAALLLPRTGWAAAYTDPDTAYIEFDPFPNWTKVDAGSETCYGWVAWVEGTTTAVFAQRFDTPRVMTVGSTENLDPFIIALETLVP